MTGSKRWAKDINRRHEVGHDGWSGYCWFDGRGRRHSGLDGIAIALNLCDRGLPERKYKFAIAIFLAHERSLSKIRKLQRTDPL